MSALIRVVASSQSAQIRPGEWAELTLTIQNFGEVVDRYQITVEGLDPSWVLLSRNELALFPKDQDQTRITLRPPAGPEARAGRYPAQIHVTSLDTPGERTSITFNLEIVGQAGLVVALEPPRQKGPKGLFNVSVSNPGNADLTVFLSAMDAEGRCLYTFRPPSLPVPAGQSRQAQLTVTPLAALPGRGPHLIPFTVLAQPAESPDLAQQVQGQWEMVPKKAPAWLVWGAVGAGAFLVLGALVAAFVLLVLPRLHFPGTPEAAVTTRPVGPTGTIPPVVPTTALPGVPTEPMATPAPTPGLTPSPPPTPDLWAEMRSVLDNYNQVRAKAETTLDPELMRKIAIDPYLTTKMQRIQANKKDNSHWETPFVSFSITALTPQGPDQVEVWVTKTETKLFYPKGATQPDDETCAGAIYSYRDCTYQVRYVLVRQGGAWYVSVAEDHGDCKPTCQH